MIIGPLFEDKPIPIVVRPKNPEEKSVAALQNYVMEHYEELEKIRLEKGAILFRGFDVKTAQDFEDVAVKVHPKLVEIFVGLNNRKRRGKYVFTSTEVPKYVSLSQHAELAYMPNRPSRIFFCCLKAPPLGGETPICDMQKVTEQLRKTHPNVIKKFKTHGLRYHLNYSDPKNRLRHPAEVKTWPEIYGTDDKKKVEESTAKDNIECRWDGNKLTLVTQYPALHTHPDTGVDIWSNTGMAFYPRLYLYEHWKTAMIGGLLYFWIIYFFWVLLEVFIRRPFLSDNKCPLYITYGNGNNIETNDMKAVSDAVWDHIVIFKWQEGDILFLDNNRVSHGRNPFLGGREIIVSLGLPEEQDRKNK